MYEAEKQRLMNLLTTATGITRTYNADLAREADERAVEAFGEVGFGPQPDGSYKGISHPTQMELESRLGPTWAGKGVGEIAVWQFLHTDPVASIAKAWMDSAAHKKVLMDTKYKHWGPGIFTFLPTGEPEIARRWYAIMLVSINAPEVVVPERFTDVKAGDPHYADIMWLVDNGITGGTGSGSTYSPLNPVTRAQLATFLHRLYDKIKSEQA